MTQRKANLTTTLSYSHTMTMHSALIVITRTTYTRRLREPQQVMLCQSAADLSTIDSTYHPPVAAFNCGNVHVWGGSVCGTVIT